MWSFEVKISEWKVNTKSSSAIRVVFLNRSTGDGSVISPKVKVTISLAIFRPDLCEKGAHCVFAYLIVMVICVLDIVSIIYVSI